MASLVHPDPPLSDGEITLRALRPDDADAVVELLQDPEIPRWTRVPSPYRPEDFHDWYRDQEAQATLGVGLHFLVVDHADRPIGAVGLNELDRARGVGDIGYWVAASHRGRGVCPRAVRLLSRWLLDELGLQAVEILVHHENAPSRAAARRAGFIETGEYRQVARLGGGADYVVHVYPPDAVSAGAG
jgi:RimJ/RimL family protein N-acetyltransferase